MSRTPKRLLFGVVTLALFFIALEAASRLLGAVDYPPDPLIADGNAGWNHSREYDPLLFWRLRPGPGV